MQIFFDVSRKALRSAASVVVLGLLGSLAGCGGGGGGSEAATPPSNTTPTPTLQSIEVTPSIPQAAAGTTAQFSATGIYTDGTHKDMTAEVTWSSSNTAAATISNDASSKGLARTAGIGSTTVSATSGSVSGSTSLTVTPAVLVSIGVTPASPSVAKGMTRQFTATGVFSDNSTQDLTTQVSWSSSDTGVATVSNAAGSNGLARAGGVGSTTVSATSGGVRGSTTLTVTPAVLVSIGVTPASPIVAKGITRQFAATGVFSDNSTQDLTTQVSWSSSDTGVATVSNAAGSIGLARAGGVGSTTVSATSGGVRGSTTLTVTPAVLVSIGVTPASPSVAKGLTQQFTATGVYTDNSTQDLTTQVTWSSSDTSVATVSNAAGSNGLATTAAVGSSTISATSGGVSGSTALTVTPAVLVSIGVTPASASIAKGLTQQFTATGVYTDNSTQDLTTQVTWSSSDTGVATVSNATGSNGLTTTTDVGSSTISATSGDVNGSTTLTVTAATLVSIDVTPASPSVAKGLTRQFIATGVYTDNTTQDLSTAVTWASSDGAVATVSNAVGSNGLVSTSAVGSTTVSATSGSVSGSTSLTVTAATLVSIEVTPASPSIANGLTRQFTATGVYTDNSTQDLTTQVTWSSSDTGVATVSNAVGSNGLATTTTVGSSTVSATSGSVSGSTTLTVTPAALVSIDVTPATPSVAKGLTQQFTATGVYTDNTTQDLTTQVTWLSSDTGVATVSNAVGSNGLATTTTVGSSTISASLGGVSGSTSLTVTAATLVSIDVTPAASSVAKGLTQQFTATGVYTDNTTQDLTTQVTWLSSDTGVATVSNAVGSNGLATTTTVGSSTISASLGGVSGSTLLTVTAATLVSIDVTPVAPSVAKGLTRQFTATGVYTDSSTQDLTTSATWTSSNTGVATVSNAAGSNGLATTTAVGGSTISASVGGVSGSTALTVSAATLVSIQVAPSVANLPNGLTRQFTATGVYTDNSTQDLTTAVAWVSSNTGVATVSNAAGSNGLATIAGVGTTTISASVGGVSGSTSLVAQSVDVSGRSNPWNQAVNPTMPYSNDAFAPIVVQLNTLNVVAGSYLNLVCTGGITNAGGLPNTGCAGLNTGYEPSNDRFQPACNHYYPTKYVDSSYYPTYIMQVLGAFADANGVVLGRPFPISPNTLRVQVPTGAVKLQLGMNDCLNSDNSSLPLTLRIFN